MADFILDIIELSAVMAAAVIALLLLKKPASSRFSAWSRYVVWTLVVIRLCIPVGAGFADPVFTVTLPEKVTAEAATGEVTKADVQSPSAEQTEKAEQTLPTETGALTEAVPQSTVPAETLPPSVVMPAESEAVRPQVTVPSVQEPTLEREKTPAEIDTRRVLSIIGYLWLAGALGYFAFRMGAYALFTVRIKRELRSADGRLLRIYETLCTQLNIKRTPRLYVSRVPVSPMLYGYISPRIVIPDLEFADEEKICQILIHELIHHRRGDIYVKLLCTVAIAVHWFNPAAYVAASRCVSSMELACDEAVVRTMSESDRARYGETLLEIVRRCADIRTSSMTTGMNSRRSNVKERIMNILDTNKKKRGVAIVAAVLCLCIIAGGVVGCAVGEDPEKPDSPVTDNDNAIYYVPEYMKIVDSLDTYEVKLSFEEDKLLAERTKNGEADVTYTALYDGERLTAVEVRDAEGELIRTKSLSYDENGNVTLISYTSADNTREYSRTEYAYGDGHLQSIIYTEDDEPGQYKISYIYSEDGRVVIEDRNRTMYYLHHERIEHHYNSERLVSMTELYRSYDSTKPALQETIEVKKWDGDKILSSVNEYDVPDYYTSNLDGKRINTYTYDSFGNVLTHKIDSELERYDTDNMPNWALLTNTYTKDGLYLISQVVEGNYAFLENSLLEYNGEFNAEKLESSGFVLQGTQLKWRECDKAEYLRYRAVYETQDTLSEEAQAGYLLGLDSHMWCFDDVVSDVSDAAEPYVPFEGKNIELEAEARKEWYVANGFPIETYGGMMSAVEAFLTGDIDRLGEYVFATEGAYESYLGMKIGNYKLESRAGRHNGQVIALTVDILESNHELLTPGTHTLIAERTLNTELKIEDVYFDTDYSVYEEPFNKRAGCLLRYGIADVDEFRSGINGEYNEFATWFCIYGMMDNFEEYMKIIEKNGGNGLIAEDLKAYAEKYLGVPDFEPYTGDRHRSYAYTYNGEYYNSAGRGDNTPAISYGDQVIDGNKVTVTVHGWADQSRTVKSKTVEYVFEKLDGGIKIVSSRILEDTGFDLSLGNGT